MLFSSVALVVALATKKLSRLQSLARDYLVPSLTPVHMG